jgi:hypothetical protein
VYDPANASGIWTRQSKDFPDGQADRDERTTASFQEALIVLTGDICNTIVNDVLLAVLERQGLALEKCGQHSFVCMRVRDPNNTLPPQPGFGYTVL